MAALVNMAKYPDLADGYRLYSNRSMTTPRYRVLREKDYNRVVKYYCEVLAEILEKEGRVNLPCGLGMIVAVNIRKRPVYDSRDGKYRPARNIDWDLTRQSGQMTYKDGTNTFGFVYVPKIMKSRGVLRCLGFVANRQLYRRMRKMYDEGTLPFYLADKDIYRV